jgi:hypothetical protein
MYWLSHRPNRKRGKRKVQNQRLPKKAAAKKNLRHVLDAQVFSKREKRLMRSMKLRALLWSVAVLVSIIAVAVTSRKVVHKYLFWNPELALSQLIVETDGILDRGRILRLARVQENQNLFSIDLDEVRENLLRMPQVQSVAIKRALPGTLRISVEERFAVAWLECKAPMINPKRGPRVLLDREGIPFVCDSFMREYMQLPVVSVQRLQSIVPGTMIESPHVTAALKVLFLSRQALYDYNLEILAIYSPNPYSLVAKYNNGSNVTFGLNDLETQVANLRAALQHAKSINKSIAEINLLLTKNIPLSYTNSPVTNLEDSETSAAANQPPSPQQPSYGQAGHPEQPERAQQDVQVAVVVPTAPVAMAGASLDLEQTRSKRNQTLIRSILGN